jgi:hypothetical protein
MQAIGDNRQENKEYLFRDVLDHYEFVMLTQKARKRLELAFVLSNKGGKSLTQR